MKPIKKRLILVSCLLAICCFASFSAACQEQDRRPSLFLIPDGYVGWVRIDFRVEGAPKLSLDDDHYIFKFPTTGIVKTSSALEEGYAEDKYFYYSTSGSDRRPLRGSTSGGDGMIWGEMVGRNQDQKELHQYFFVGTEKEFNEIGLKAKDNLGNPIAGPIAATP